MFKKIFATLLIFCIMNLTILPTFAKNEMHKTNTIINAEFKTDLNVNKASRGQVVQFISTENYNVNGFEIPKGTIFSGEIKHMKKGRFGYRRAKAIITINKMILPNGEIHEIKAGTQRRVLKGSATGNITKGIITAPIAIVTGAVGIVVILVESISIVGILAIGPTSYLFGEAMGKLTHGINYKKYEGDEIQLKLKAL
jgi:hypothetical protein